MNIRVQFYSHLRDLAGGSELSIDLPDKATVGDLLTKIYEKVPTVRSRDRSILIGVGVEFVDRNYELKPGEEISIMPPVQGGWINQKSVAEILEICGDAKVAAAHELNYGLQVVFLLPSDANLLILHLALHLESLRLNRLDDFLGLVPLEALPNF